MYNDNRSFVPVHKAQQPEYRCVLSSAELKNVFADCADFEMREIIFGLDTNTRVYVCWLDGIVSGSELSESVLRPLTDSARSLRGGDRAVLQRLLSGSVYSYSAKHRTNAEDVINDLTHGHCSVIFDGIGEAVSFEVRSSNTRAVSEPSLEKSVKGAKDAFTETMRVNTALVRRRIASPKLKTYETRVGRKSHTKLTVLYLDGVAAPETVEELKRRLDALDVDALVSTGTLEEYIVDAPLSPFPQLIHTERPDRLSMYLLEGRVGILIDGLPLALVLPVSFADFMRVTGDSSNSYIVATVLTVLRWLSLLLSLILPALYVAVAMYHQEMIPTRLLLSVIEAKRNVPFSTALEVLGMLITFELLQEAGLRLPNPIGDTVSIIGALIVGQSAVEAQVASPIAIIVVALAGIAGYTLPSQDLGSAVRLTRFALVLAAVGAGLYGVGAGLCLLLLHLCSLDSFSLNYTAPLSDGEPFPLFRLLIQKPKPARKLRDAALNTPDKRRQQ